MPAYRPRARRVSDSRVPPAGRHEDLDAAVQDTSRIDRQPHRRIVEALARPEIEVLLEDGRGDLGDAVAIADDAAGDHERLAEGVEVGQRVHVTAVARADDGDLLAVDQRRGARAGSEPLEPADVDPATLGQVQIFHALELTALFGNAIG